MRSSRRDPDIPVRNMDFHGADELADSLAVTTPDGMDKMLKNLPKQAQTIVQSLQAQLQQSRRADPADGPRAQVQGRDRADEGRGRRLVAR
jgi:hypothetical protein